MTAKEIKTNKGEAPEVVAKRQAAYRQKQMKEGLVRAQLWVTPEEKVYLNTKLETLRKSKLIRDVSKDNQLTQDILSGSFDKYKKKWTKKTDYKYYSNAFFNTDEYSYGQIKNNIPGKLPDALIIFKLKNTKKYPIIKLRGLGDPSVICAILHCLHTWYFESQHKYDRRKRVIDLHLYNLCEDLKKMIYKAKSSVSFNLSETPFAFFMQPIYIDSEIINEDDLENLETDQLVLSVDDNFNIIKCSDQSFTFEDILKWSGCLLPPTQVVGLNTQNARLKLMNSLIDLIRTGSECEVPTRYLNKIF